MERLASRHLVRLCALYSQSLVHSTSLTSHSTHSIKSVRYLNKGSPPSKSFSEKAPKNEGLDENFEKFRQEIQQQEQTEALKQAREKYQKVEEKPRKDLDQVSNDTNTLDVDIIKEIKELITEKIRPVIQEDGGDLEFVSYEDNVVKVRLQGACISCPSSTITLQNGIKNMLQFYIPEIRDVEQVIDE